MYCEATSRYNTHPPFPTFKQIFTNILTSFLLATYLFYLRPRKFNRKFHLCFFCISTRPFPRAWPSLLLRECNAWLATICTESEGKPVSPFRGIINKHVLLWVCLPFFFFNNYSKTCSTCEPAAPFSSTLHLCCSEFHEANPSFHHPSLAFPLFCISSLPHTYTFDPPCSLSHLFPSSISITFGGPLQLAPRGPTLPSRWQTSWPQPAPRAQHGCGLKAGVARPPSCVFTSTVLLFAFVYLQDMK